MRVILALILVAATASMAQSQETVRHRRQGFWIGAGIGTGLLGAATEGGGYSGSQRLSGPTLYVRLGTALKTNLLLGAQVAGWANYTYDDQSLTVGTVDLDWYPGASPLFVRLGGLRFRPGNSTSQLTPALSAGVGYEIRISDEVSITPFANGFASLARASNTGSTVQDAPRGTVQHNLLQIGIGITSR